MAVRVRRDIWTLESAQTWHPVTRAYALAVGEMKRRRPSDPTSWVYQAQVHGMGNGGQPDQFRGQCQHNGWFFLPWHRIYLHWFEQIVLAAVVAHPEVDAETRQTWALPYWNYTPGGRNAQLPPPFREPELPDAPGTPNPLFDHTRAINGPRDHLPLSAIGVEALNEDEFTKPAFTSGGFGGVPTGFNHLHEDPNNSPGMLEQTPHGSVHNEVGGNMGAFSTAGLDPIFWLHHSNIDRLWAVWIAMRARSGPHVNPDPRSAWGTTTSHFHRPDGTPVTGDPAGVLDTVADLGYQYEDITVPVPPPPFPRRLVPSEPTPQHAAELLGSTEVPLALAGGTKRVGLSIGAPAGPARTRSAAGTAHTYLLIEGIRAAAQHDLTYEVYLGLPEDPGPDGAPAEHYVGNLSFFGAEQAGQVDADPAGHGLNRSYDITTLVAELTAAGRWDPDDVSVTFVPARDLRAGEAPPPVTVGRVGISTQ